MIRTSGLNVRPENGTLNLNTLRSKDDLHKGRMKTPLECPEDSTNI